MGIEFIFDLRFHERSNLAKYSKTSSAKHQKLDHLAQRSLDHSANYGHRSFSKVTVTHRR